MRGSFARGPAISIAAKDGKTPSIDATGPAIVGSASSIGLRLAIDVSADVRETTGVWLRAKGPEEIEDVGRSYGHG